MLFNVYRSGCLAHCGGSDVIIWLAGAPHDGIATVLALTNVAGSILRIDFIRQLRFGDPLDKFDDD
jgi:hypothetical protein